MSSINRVNSVDGVKTVYSAVLPPPLMVFFVLCAVKLEQRVPSEEVIGCQGMEWLPRDNGAQELFVPSQYEND